MLRVAAVTVLFAGVLILGDVSHAAVASTSASPTASSPTTEGTATPTPSPSTTDQRPQEIGNDDHEQSGSDQWFIALAAALLTLLGDRIWGWWQDRKSLKALLGYLSTEVERNREDAVQRSARQPTDPFTFDPPLGAAAWDVVRTSAVSWRLARRRQLFNDLVVFYDAVDGANHRSQVASQIFTMTQTGDLDGEVAKAYHSKAMSLTIDPYGAVIEASGPAMRSINSNTGDA